MRRIYLMWLAVFAFGMSPPAWAATDSRDEFWKNDAEGWVVEVRECDHALCGFLVSYRMVHPHPSGYVPIDELNPDPTRRSTPLCGLQLIGGFKPSTRKDGDWDSGWVYNPDTGKTYTGAVTKVNADTVKLRAYIGIPLLGRTLVLHRVADVPGRCAVPPKSP
jgi:uncharacterized protein (DUF2147 family)